MENKWFRRSWILVKVRWQFAGPTYCRSMGCCQIESCALSGNFVSCYAKFCLTIASWHFGVHVCKKAAKHRYDQYRNMLFTAAMHNYKHDWTLNEEPGWNPDCILASSVGSSIRLSGYGRIELQPVANKSKRFKRETQKPCLSTRWNNFVTSITTYKN